MQKTPSVRSQLTLDLSNSQRRVLEWLASSTRDDANVGQRAQFILDWADGLTGQESAELRNASQRTVSKWRCRFRKGGIASLSDLPRPGAPRSIPKDMVAELERLRQTPPPPGKPSWTTRLLAEYTGMSQSSVVRLNRHQGQLRALELLGVLADHGSSGPHART